MRRVDPSTLTVILAGAAATLAEPEYSAMCSLHTTLVKSGSKPASSRMDSHPGDGEPTATTAAKAVRFVRGDGTVDEPPLSAAYLALDPTERTALHDQRAPSWNPPASRPGGSARFPTTTSAAVTPPAQEWPRCSRRSSAAC